MIGALPVYFVGSQIVALDRDLGLTSSRLGVSIGATFAVMALSAPWFGHVLPRFSVGASLRLSSASVAFALFGLAVFCTEWWHVAMWLAVAGLGNTGAQIGSNLALSRGADLNHRGLAFGLKQAAIPAASLLAGLCVPLLTLNFGWRATFAAGAGVAVVLALYRPGLEWSSEPAAQRSGALGMKAVLGLIGFGAFFASAIGNALPSFAVDSGVTQGMSEATAASLLAVASLCSVGVRISVGMLADRRASNGLAEFAWLTFLAVISFILLLLSNGSQILFALAMIFAFSTAWGWAGLLYFAGTSLVPRRAGPVHRGRRRRRSTTPRSPPRSASEPPDARPSSGPTGAVRPRTARCAAR